MVIPINPDALPFRIDLLSVCRSCGLIYGDLESVIPGARSKRRQDCDCRSPGHCERRPADVATEVVALCRGRRPLIIDSRRSVWFCRSFSTAIQTVNQACSTFVIPLSRHTLLEQMELDADDGREIRAYVPDLGDWFDRVERLEMHAQSVVRHNVRKQLGDESQHREIRSSSI